MTRRASLWNRLLAALRPDAPPVPASFGFRLSSRLQDAYFRVRFAVLPYPSLQVREHVKEIAAREAGSASALEADLLETRLRLSLVDSGLGFTYLRVRVTAEEAGIRLAEEYEQLARDRVLGEERAKDIVEGLRFFRSQVLEQDLLGLWWLNAERDRLPQLGRSGEQIENAIAMLRADGGGKQTDRLLSLYQRLLESIDGSERHRLVSQLIKLFQIWDRPDLVQEISRTYPPSQTWSANGDGHVPQSGVIGVGRPYR